MVGLDSQSSDIVKLHADLFKKHGITAGDVLQATGVRKVREAASEAVAIELPEKAFSLGIQ